MNLIVVAQFFETICISNFEHFLAVGSNDGGLVGSVSTYFGMIETNGWGMFYLYYLDWLCGAFYLLKIHNQLCLDPVYAAEIVEFIENIIRCSLVSRLQAEILS